MTAIIFTSAKKLFREAINMSRYLLGGLITLFITPTGYAEIVMDGTVGWAQTLLGPQFDIRAEYGQQVGTNLFHSFQTFNLAEGEIATFSGSNLIENVISRVTGNTPSFIDGTLRSTMPQANMYFINPAGIILGEHAHLDVHGAMHFSTADELLLGREGKWSAQQPQNSVLTVAPPSAFGFLSNSPSAITIQGSHLSVNPNQTLSFLGGELNLQAETVLEASPGRLNLASVASPGLIIPTPTDLEMNHFSQQGKLTATATKLDVSGEGSGSLFIRAGQLFLEQSEVLGITTGSQDGGIIDIATMDLTLKDGSRISSSTKGSGHGGNIFLKVANMLHLFGTSTEESPNGIFAQTLANEDDAGVAGAIQITAGNLKLEDGAEISSATKGFGQGGNIELTIADTLQLASQSGILANTESEETDAGDAGLINIDTKNLQLSEGAVIQSSTFGFGQGGKIDIRAGAAITLSSSAAILANAERYSTGDGGVINIQTAHLTLTDGAQIATAAFSVGKGGVIYLNVADSTLIEGYSSDDGGKLYSSGISATTEGSGDAGAIWLITDQLLIREGAGITSSTYYDSGQGGEVHIEATDFIDISSNVSVPLTPIQQQSLGKGIASASQQESSGNAGRIVLRTSSLKLHDGGEISTAAELAKAGEIELYLDRLQVADKAAITSESQGQGDAGNIFIEANDRVEISQAKISTQAGLAGGGNITVKTPQLLDIDLGAITTSVKTGIGNGGNVTIENPLFVVLDEGQIRAQADEGRGGDIRITSQQYLRSTESVVSASSRLGVDGKIVISSPNETINAGFIVLPVNFLDASALLKKSCQASSKVENRSHFVYLPLAGTPLTPYDWKPSPLLPPLARETAISLSPLQPMPSPNLISSKLAFLDCYY
jgi:filamentous hemagglutinin family protein